MIDSRAEAPFEALARFADLARKLDVRAGQRPWVGHLKFALAHPIQYWEIWRAFHRLPELITPVVTAWLAGELPQKEFAQVEFLLHDSPLTREVADPIISAWDHARPDLEPVDVDAAYARFERMIQQEQMR